MQSRDYGEHPQVQHKGEDDTLVRQRDGRINDHMAPSKTFHQKPAREKVEESTENAVQEAQEEVRVSKRHWYQSIHWGYVLLVVYAIQLSLFAILAVWVHFHPVDSIDIAITREFQENQSPWLNYSMIAVSYLGAHAIIFGVLVLVTALIFMIVRLYLEAITIIVVTGTAGLLNELIKLLVARPRPSASLVDVITKAAGASFPSGHVMTYVAFFGLLFSFGIILFRGNRWWRIALLIVSALFVVLVGPSRIYLGDHWASDVLGGYLFGGAWLGICLWIYLKLKQRGIMDPKRGRARQPQPDLQLARHADR